MGTVRKVGEKWRAEVCVGGRRTSKRFDRKNEAMRWIVETEAEIVKVGQGGVVRTLRDAVRRYAAEESPLRRGARWELVRLAAFETPLHQTLPLDKPVAAIVPEDLAIWRDARSKVVAPGTVLRDMNLIASVFETARRNWRWCPLNPARDVRKPPEPKHREVTINKQQIKAVAKALGYQPGERVGSVSGSVAVAFLVALRTGMRAGEICALTWADVDIDARGTGVAKLRTSKTGKGRDVPLTAKAVRLINAAQGWDPVSVFALKPHTLDALFRRAKARSGLEKAFVFHDARHTAATWMAGRMKSNGAPAQQALLDLCKIFGWTKIDRALTYYNPSATDIAARM